MFGYLRPLKTELLVREWMRYRSVYCGICKQISQEYGQLPRLATNYDLTLLGILLLALTDEQPPDDPESCVLNPFVKKPIVHGGSVIELCAGLTVILAWHKAADQISDNHPVQGRAAKLVFARAHRKAAKKYPAYEQIVRESLAELSAIEAGPPDKSAADSFGKLLQMVFQKGAALVIDDERMMQAIGLVGRDFGRWIYLIDAIDDHADDCNNGNWNPYGNLDATAAREMAEADLTAIELDLDRTAALLPYCRDGNLVANIVIQGLPAVRRTVFAGKQLGRL